jgi:tape measure domain-containing protein
MANNLEYILRLKDQFSKTMQGAMTKVKNLDTTMSKIKNRFTEMSSAAKVGWAIAGAGALSFAKSVFDALDNAQKFHASIKTMLYGNEGAAKALEQQLINLAKTTPFQLTEVQDASKQLLAYGFKAGELVETMKRLGDVSAGIGAPLGDIAYLYGTLKTSGRVTLMDLRQFAGRGIPIYETLAKRLKVTTNEINNMVSAGKIGFKDIEGAFKDMTKEGGQFFNLMADQSKTVGGQLSNLGDGWEQLKVKIGQSQEGIIASTLNWANSLVNSINDGIDAMNLLDRAFKGTESSQYSFFEKYITGTLGKLAGAVGMKPTSGGYAEMQQYAGSMKANLGDTSKDKLSAAENNLRLSKIIKNIFADSTMSAIEKNRRVAILQDIRKSNLEAMKLFDMKANKNLSVDENGNVVNNTAKSTLETGSEVSGKRPQSLTINIDKLIEQFNLSTTNIQEGTTRVKEMVAKALLESVNDINLMATS